MRRGKRLDKRWRGRAEEGRKRMKEAMMERWKRRIVEMDNRRIWIDGREWDKMKKRRSEESYRGGGGEKQKNLER